MKRFKAKLTILIRGPGRQQEEEWETIEPQEVVFWQRAAKHLAARTYEHEGCRAIVKVNWLPLARKLSRDFELQRPLRTGQRPDPKWFAKVQRPLRLNVICDLSGENILSNNDWYSKFFVEYYVYEIFSIANLALPGSAEFLNVEILQLDENAASLRPTRLGLSAYYFSEWMIESVRGNKPAAKSLPVEMVVEWFAKVNPVVTQKAENATQRALFAMYHLCHSDGEIDFILWLFHALESLLSTKVGENFSGLVRRASLLLDLPEKETKNFSKRLRKLYDLRSSFVHGGYEIAHPLHRESIDPRLDDDYGKLLELGHFGFSLLAALLQSMIERQVPLLKFEETLVL